MARPKLPELLNPIERERQQRPSYSEKYEEELRASLFKDDTPVSDATLPIIVNGWAHHARPGEEWDVPIDEPIQYFDPELSYELTGYRPITMDKGLDFDPTPFREDAIVYMQNGCYTKFPKGSKPCRDFWKERMRRMKEGYTVGKYRITGDNYYFINYYRMETIVEDAIAGAGRVYSFPTFLSKQYEWFHYLEMAEHLHKDAAALKSRGVN